MAVSIGEYNDRILVLKRVLAAADSTGEQVQTWPTASTNKKYWCKARRLNGTERIAAGQMNTSLAVEFRIHGRAPDIEVTDRITFQNQEFSISGVYFDDDDVLVNAFLPVQGA